MLLKSMQNHYLTLPKILAASSKRSSYKVLCRLQSGKRFYTVEQPVTHFFKIINCHINRQAGFLIPTFIKDQTLLNNILHEIAPHLQENYIYNHFTYWLSRYAATNPSCLSHYLSNAQQDGLNEICKDFIKFCFRYNIVLEKDKTLTSFAYHDSLSDQAVKAELLAKLKPKKTINLLGFGLGDGYYEKNIAQYLIKQRLAQTVKIFGFEPNSQPTQDIEFITANQLNKKMLYFDVITARWVLHHVELKYRWNDFIKCINHTNPNSIGLIVEHGFLSQNIPSFDKKLYYLFNATFDIIANIGLRPWWFTDTAPDIGANFYIHYLEFADFEKIKEDALVPATQHFYDVGPDFPSQTVCSMEFSPTPNL